MSTSYELWFFGANTPSEEDTYSWAYYNEAYAAAALDLGENYIRGFRDPWDGVRTGPPYPPGSDVDGWGGGETPSRKYIGTVWPGFDANIPRTNPSPAFGEYGYSTSLGPWIRIDEDGSTWVGTTAFEYLNGGASGADIGGPYEPEGYSRGYEVGLMKTCISEPGGYYDEWYTIYSAVTTEDQDPAFSVTDNEDGTYEIGTTVYVTEESKLADKYKNNKGWVDTISTLADLSHFVTVVAAATRTAELTPTFKKIKNSQASTPTFSSVEGTTATDTRTTTTTKTY